ncbi:MAG: nucleotidyl transferase AbiEii/AbiGii toxin family protein [Candidatus Omnitrophica bacterium]|nr:nucleotidyl transferase AbiEii/AbiGii toxin family protein [Candidatus Omnitrophota bacterium]
MKFRPAIIEKDYYLTVILNNIEALLTDKVVFKGGTLLNKMHLNYRRLSEDLDFTYYAPLSARSQRSKAITPIREKMPDFLKALQLTSDKPEGEGFNNSKQYVFKVKYPSVLTEKDDVIKIEISLRQPPLDKPVHTGIKHFYQDPFTGKDLFPSGEILSLSWNEAVAEKLKAAISRKDVVIRDYYDLWYISEFGFDFYDKNFIRIFKSKVIDEGYAGNYKENFGLSADNLSFLRKQIGVLLKPVIRSGEEFDLDKVLERFNEILGDKRFQT